MVLAEFDRKLIEAEVRREVGYDAEVSAHIAYYRSLETPALFVEIQPAHAADFGEVEGMVVGFNHGISDKVLDLRILAQHP